jgi:hypothetical protein
MVSGDLKTNNGFPLKGFNLLEPVIHQQMQEDTPSQNVSYATVP